MRLVFGILVVSVLCGCSSATVEPTRSAPEPSSTSVGAALSSTEPLGVGVMPTGRAGAGGSKGLPNLRNTGGPVEPPAPDTSPKAAVAVGAVAVEGGAIANASAVVAGMAAGFRRCFKVGLKEQPEMHGTLQLVAEVGPGGEVTSAKASETTTLSNRVVECVTARVASALFAPPEGGRSKLSFPATFTPN